MFRPLGLTLIHCFGLTPSLCFIWRSCHYGLVWYANIISWVVYSEIWLWFLLNFTDSKSRVICSSYSICISVKEFTTENQYQSDQIVPSGLNKSHTSVFSWRCADAAHDIIICCKWSYLCPSPSSGWAAFPIPPDGHVQHINAGEIFLGVPLKVRTFVRFDLLFSHKCEFLFRFLHH